MLKILQNLIKKQHGEVVAKLYIVRLCDDKNGLVNDEVPTVHIVGADEHGIAYGYQHNMHFMPWRNIFEIECERVDV